MIGTSDQFRAEVKKSHQAVCRMDIIQNGQVVMTLPVFDGSVTADRTSAQMRQFSASVADPDGTLTPADMNAVLAPFGTRVKLYRGVRIPNIVTIADLDNTVVTWADGTNNGTVADPATGDLILGFT